MNTNELFQQAVTDSKSLPAKPDNDTLLELYSLYKQATEGDATGEGPDNMFDFVGIAKFKAWNALQGKSKEDAMEEYVALVGRLKG